MKTLCSEGFKISTPDQKVLEHYLLTPIRDWGVSALKGMINKAVKTILRDYIEIYKSKQTGNISSDLSVLIPAIIAMPEFKPYKYQTPERYDKFDKNDLDEIQRDESCNIEIWENGFDIEDYEEIALNAFYENPEAQLRWFMNNKVYRRKNAFIKKYQKKLIADQISFPSRHDAFINFVTSQEGYKTRAESENEEFP